MSAKLVDPRSGKEHPLQEGRNSLGRLPGNAITFPGRAISRFHAEISWVNGAWVLEDLGSSYGTYVNGSKVEGQVVLRDGDQVRLAVTRHFPGGELNLIFRETGAQGGPAAGPKDAAHKVLADQQVEEGRMVFEHPQGALLVRLSGIFRKPEMDALVGKIWKALAARPLNVALDVSRVSHLNRYGLSVLLDLAARLREQGQALRVFGAAGTVHRLLLMPGERNPIELCASEEQALRGA
jgi:anti-anti-sigma regulatory factor